MSWGDPTLDSGQFKVSGAVRSRYLHKDYVVGANEGSQNDDWRLTDIKLVLGYENQTGLQEQMLAVINMIACVMRFF